MKPHIRTRYAYVVLALLSIGLSAFSIFISIQHDKADNQKFCITAIGNAALLKALDISNPDPSIHRQVQDAYRRYLILEKELECD